MFDNEYGLVNADDVEDAENAETDKDLFGNFAQSFENIDKAMEAMIDNYTDGVEHLSEENGLDNIKFHNN